MSKIQEAFDRLKPREFGFEFENIKMKFRVPSTQQLIDIFILIKDSQATPDVHTFFYRKQLICESLIEINGINLLENFGTRIDKNLKIDEMLSAMDSELFDVLWSFVRVNLDALAGETYAKYPDDKLFTEAELEYISVNNRVREVRDA